jgi:hypothetical protein
MHVNTRAVPEGISATVGKTDRRILQSLLQRHEWRTARYRIATRPRLIVRTVIKDRKD